MGGIGKRLWEEEESLSVYSVYNVSANLSHTPERYYNICPPSSRAMGAKARPAALS